MNEIDGHTHSQQLWRSESNWRLKINKKMNRNKKRKQKQCKGTGEMKSSKKKRCSNSSSILISNRCSHRNLCISNNRFSNLWIPCLSSKLLRVCLIKIIPQAIQDHRKLNSNHCSNQFKRQESFNKRNLHLLLRHLLNPLNLRTLSYRCSRVLTQQLRPRLRVIK